MRSKYVILHAHMHVWMSKLEDHTWFTRIPYPKNRVRTTSSNEGRPFTSNINAIESFPTELCMQKKGFENPIRNQIYAIWNKTFTQNAVERHKGILTHYVGKIFAHLNIPCPNRMIPWCRIDCFLLWPDHRWYTLCMAHKCRHGFPLC